MMVSFPVKINFHSRLFMMLIHFIFLHLVHKAGTDG
ncbi:cytoplasmic tyrosine kinase, Dscr28C related (Drosophila), isoform CRA_c [Mus musculus]|nr:cytoplasmic tyrosine kinase, Dscr28C related (Drosophila), isoform CRA_c [Mus musculus]